MLLYKTKTSAIKEYPMVCANFDYLKNCFQISIILKPRCYVLNLGLDFINTIAETTSKVTKRKMSFVKFWKVGI